MRVKCKIVATNNGLMVLHGSIGSPQEVHSSKGQREMISFFFLFIGSLKLPYQLSCSSSVGWMDGWSEGLSVIILLKVGLSYTSMLIEELV